jgi:hypothetical protein
VWRSVKDGIVKTARPMRVVRDDDELVALYLCPGTRYQRRTGVRGGPRGRSLLPGGWSGEYEEAEWHTNRVLVLNVPGSAHSVSLFWRETTGELWGWYVDVEVPWRRTSLGFDTLDQVLDILVTPDVSSWRMKDEDELAWAVEVGNMTPAAADAVRAEAARAIELIRQRASPYCDGWEKWLPDLSWSVPELPPDWRDTAT